MKKKLSLKCKAYVKFEGEINSMTMLKKTWIEGYNGGRLASIKDHCNGKPHMKTFCSFKASVLKISAEVGQKEVGASVSLDEFKQLKRKSIVALLKMIYCSNSVDLVTRKGILNFKKVIESLYVNKNGCREFISAHGEVSISNVVEVFSKPNFFSILMDGSKIH